MNLINNFNNVAFGSNYKYNVTSKNLSSNVDIEDKLYCAIGDGYEIYTDFTPLEEACKTGVFEKVHISAKDQYDSFIESVLKQCNINFSKQTKKEALNPENIYSRIVLDEYQPNRILTSLDTKKVDCLLKLDKDTYITPNGTEGTISDRYEGVKEYLETGRNIDATKLCLYEENGELRANITDGRHRFAVMRDMGMEKIKFSLDENSLSLARKYGLIKD